MEFTKNYVGDYSHHDGYRSWLIIPKLDGFEASYKEAPALACIFVSPTEAVSGANMIRAGALGILLTPHLFKTLEEAIQACKMKLQVLQRVIN